MARIKRLLVILLAAALLVGLAGDAAQAAEEGVEDECLAQRVYNVSPDVRPDEKTYGVTFQWSGEPPEGAALPEGGRYAPGAVVRLPYVPPVLGYSFVGWRALDAAGAEVVLTGDRFLLPTCDVVVYGEWCQEQDSAGSIVQIYDEPFFDPCPPFDAAAPAAASEPPEGAARPDDVPDTGDNGGALPAALVLISSLGLAATLIAGRQKRN